MVKTQVITNLYSEQTVNKVSIDRNTAVEVIIRATLLQQRRVIIPSYFSIIAMIDAFLPDIIRPFVWKHTPSPVQKTD